METFKKVEIAGDLFDRLTREQLEYLQPYVDDIRDIQIEISEVAKNLEQTCADCGGGCCTNGIEVGIDPITYFNMMFFLTEETRRRIIEILKRKRRDYKCGFQDETGCVIPAIARPFECKTFYCSHVIGGRDLMLHFRRPLKKSFNELELMLWSMYLKLDI